MLIKEIKLNPDRTLNILDTEKFYFMIIEFPGKAENNSIEFHIGRWDSYRKYYGFVRVILIKDNEIETGSIFNFEDIYLQYSIQNLLLYNSSNFSKCVFVCNNQQEFVKFCSDNPSIKKILIRSQGSD